MGYGGTILIPRSPHGDLLCMMALIMFVDGHKLRSSVSCSLLHYALTFINRPQQPLRRIKVKNVCLTFTYSGSLPKYFNFDILKGLLDVFIVC
jgi:hypothetical protein